MKRYSLERCGARGCQYAATRYVIDPLRSPPSPHVESPTAQHFHDNVTHQKSISALSVRARALSLPELGAKNTVPVVFFRSAIDKFPTRKRRRNGF
jgi:hypothetical protein